VVSSKLISFIVRTWIFRILWLPGSEKSWQYYYTTTNCRANTRLSLLDKSQSH